MSDLLTDGAWEKRENRDIIVQHCSFYSLTFYILIHSVLSFVFTCSAELS